MNTQNPSTPYAKPRAYVGMTTCENPKTGGRMRTSIVVYTSSRPGDYFPNTCDNLVEAANIVGMNYQLLRLPDEILTFELGIEQLPPMLFDWLKTLLHGAPWDRTAVATIGEPRVPKYPD